LDGKKPNQLLREMLSPVFGGEPSKRKPRPLFIGSANSIWSLACPTRQKSVRTSTPRLRLADTS